MSSAESSMSICPTNPIILKFFDRIFDPPFSIYELLRINRKTPNHIRLDLWSQQTYSSNFEATAARWKVCRASIGTWYHSSFYKMIFALIHVVVCSGVYIDQAEIGADGVFKILVLFSRFLRRVWYFDIKFHRKKIEYFVSNIFSIWVLNIVGSEQFRNAKIFSSRRLEWPNVFKRDRCFRRAKEK